MRLPARLMLVIALAGTALACNLQRVFNPSLPTSTSQSDPTTTSAPTQAPTPIATLSDQARVEAGDQAFLNGDWETALREYQRTLDEAEDNSLRAAALLGMGRAYLQLDRIDDAEQTFDTLFGLFPDSDQAAEAYYFLAQLYELEENPVQAAQAYQTFLEKRPGVIEAYIQEKLGDALLAAGDNDGALTAYQAAIASPQLGDTVLLQVKVGNVYIAKLDYQTAILTYQTIYNSTTNDYLKADMDLAMGRAYIAMGETAQAYELYQDAVNNYPLAYSSYAALFDLVHANVPVDDLQRGLIDYYTATATTDPGNQAELYGVAIAAFDRYLQDAPQEHSDQAHYYRALALRATSEIPKAIEEFDHIIEDHEFGEHWVDAYMEKARTQWLWQDDYDAAIETLLAFVAATPSQPAAAEFLFTAGRIAENGGRLTRASEIWPRVANEYPASEFAYDALFRAAVSRFRLEDYAGALSLFGRANQAALGLEQEAQSLFWVAKTAQTQGDATAAQTTWQQVAQIDPSGYYSERAADILAGLAPFESTGTLDLDYDVEAERTEAENWIRVTFNLPADTDLRDVSPLQSDARFVRGTEFWRLGEYELARAEFENLRQSLITDPANSYRLANYLIDLGLYRTGIFAAREVLNMVGMSDAATLDAPTYFSRLRFGAYYSDLVVPESQSEGIDPLFIFSMMRQESLFEGFVTSSAGARGLLQILPDTGQEQATLSVWPPDFTPDDLYLPVVNIRLGIDYFARQLSFFEGDLAAALAAYNGGAANVQYWLSLAEGDPDLFVEVIQFAETANHVRSVYELFDIYRNLYEPQ